MLVVAMPGISIAVDAVAKNATARAMNATLTKRSVKLLEAAL
jgi:hypothetical protein